MQEKRTGAHLAASPKRKIRKAASDYEKHVANAYKMHVNDVIESKHTEDEPCQKTEKISRQNKNSISRSKNERQNGQMSGGKAFLLIVIALIMFGGIVGMGTVEMLIRGPSEQAKIMFVRTFTDTSTLKKIPALFMPQEEVDAISDPLYGKENEVKQYGYETVTGDVEISSEKNNVYDNVIEYKDITGSSWHGKMILVHDPELLVLGTPKEARYGYYGQFLTVKEFCDEYGAIAGITAAGFDMTNGNPANFVINNNELLYGNIDETYAPTIVITADNRLELESRSVREVLDSGCKIGLSWWPILIKDGVKADNLGGGFSARSAIGQTADGTFILVVIEGRMISSLGATMDELADLMEEYGAINAVNLDSGRSAMMVYNGENVTKAAIGSGVSTEERALPNCFLVMPEGWSDNE